ncbi:uncharacterized protein LOC580083 isoform X3 [Strongylocentrotus purpuratus]|uniref:SET domain-containing protein n=1 Tax=Strongylocentrotus purpuratus TaxID=7668 RepID=A0A7M7HHD3_STRPU|nr:uncharacterized protein LOC580083 isoform X3 [Strongylocentrotus purpuratus]
MSQPLFDPSPLITSHHNVVMAAGTDSVDAVDQPVTNGDVKSQSISAQSTHMSMSHYLGLPYQDHNYGQPPPPTPPQSPPPTLDAIPVLPLATIYENANPSFTPPEDNAEVQNNEGDTRCICTFDHDDGYMICCDKCTVWQHVECMGLDRNNIPDVYFCERCEPRMVDQQKALELQTIKRKHILERLDSSDDDSKRKGKRARYSSISNTPTSLTLTSTKGKNKMKKKKKKKEKEKGKEKVKEEEKDQRQEKHHKKKKKKKFDLTLSSQRKHRKNRGRPEPGIGDLLLHGEQILENSDHFVEATENQYSLELNQYLSDQRQNAMWTMPSLGCIMDDLSPQKIKLGAAGRTARGLVATEELAPNQPIVEYRGMLMLRDQFVPANGWTKKPYLHVLMYTKFSNIELCVDARKYGNIARYVRKSCSPNAEVRHVAIDGLLRLYLFSLVEITKGSEVTVAFDYSYKDCTHPVKCACSKKNCPVKRYWRKRRSLEARNQKKPVTNVAETAEPSNRTVSPLLVSLPAANGPEKQIEETIEHKDVPKVGQEEKPPTTISISHHKSRSNRNSTEKPTKEVVAADPSSDNEHKDKVDVEAVDPLPLPQDPGTGEDVNTESSEPKEDSAKSRSKMTREERKMEAIMKAFAKMEKAQERRQQALERIAHSKPEDDDMVGQEDKDQSNKSDQQQQSSLSGKKETNEVTKSDSGKDEQFKSSDATTKDESSSNTVAPITTPLPTRKPTRRRRRSTMSSRRRHRSNSITLSASASASVEVSSADDDSNQAPPTMMWTEKSNYPSTPLSISTSINHQDKSGESPLASPGSSSSKRFRFPKTKKFFMNEWLNEKAFESLAGKPLTIKTDQLDLSYSSNLSSPNTPLLQRSGSMSALVKETRNNPLESSGGLAGSAKKRWLRQAMSEGNSNQEPAATCNGTISPIASPALSPNTSASSDLMTPLKKRMLRHSLAEEGAYGGSSPKHEPRTAQDSLPAPAIPAVNQDAPPSEEPPILIQAKAELEPVQEEDSLFVTCSERMKSQFTLTFPLPARKDVRKNSSIDSGLSVTTPAELEKSPITIKAGLEERLRDFSAEVPTSQMACKEASSDLEAKAAECPVDDAKDTNATVLAVDNNNLVKEESVKEQDDSKEVKGSEEEMKVVEKEEKVKDEVDGSVNMEVDGRTKSPVVDPILETNITIESAVDTSAKVPTTKQECSAGSIESREMKNPELLDESKNDDLVDKSKDLKNRFLTNVTKSDLNSLYVNSFRTRHVSGPGAMQGRINESGPLTLTTSFADDSGVSSSSLYTPFSPKKRLLRQNTDPNEQRDAGLSMANSWPRQSFASPQRFISPKDESHGPNPQQNLLHRDTVTPSSVGASSPLPAQGSPDRLSASWGPGLRPNINGQGVAPRNIEPGTTPSPSPSPGIPVPSAPAQGIVKPGTPPLSAVRNLGNSLSAASEGNQESAEVQTSQTTSSVLPSSATSGTASSEESAPNSAQSTPIKKKVSLLEYRKRRGSSVKPASSSSSSSSSTSTTATTPSTSITASLVPTSTTGSGKLPPITLPNIPLPDIPSADPLKDEPGKKSSKAPTKTSTSSPSTTNPSLKTGAKVASSPMKGDGGSNGKAGKPGSKPSGFAIFSTKTKDGQTPTLTLTSEAQQVINSITSLLMEESHVNGDVKDKSIRRSDSVPGETRYSRRNYQDGRGDAAGSLKRPLSPEPPPPPPGKKLCTGTVPPPPPPKGAVSRDARPLENGPTVTLRQNSAPGGCVPGPVATNSPLKNVSGNAIVPAQYGIAHRNQNPQYPMQYGQQPPQQQQQPQPQFAPTPYHQHPTQPQAPQPPPPPQQQPQAAITQPQQQQQPARPVPPPVPPPQKHTNFNYQYSNQTTENANAQGFPQQQQRTGYPPVPYHQNQNQISNHFGVQNKFPTNGRKSPYGSQDSNRQHTFYNRGTSNAYPARKNFHSK